MLSLGLWHNFGTVDPFEESRAMIRRAFELGITHFDLANNYGPSRDRAEETFGKVSPRDLAGHRDEMIISTKAGWRMWPGPYGDGGRANTCWPASTRACSGWGSTTSTSSTITVRVRKRRSRRAWPRCAEAVKQGKALYVGISAYDADETRAAAAMLRDRSARRCFVHQPKYSMLGARHRGRDSFRR